MSTTCSSDEACFDFNKRLSHFLAYMTKRDLKSLVIPLFTIVLSKKLFDDKKSAFIAVLIAPLKRVRRMVISVGFAKTVNAIL